MIISTFLALTGLLWGYFLGLFTESELRWGKKLLVSATWIISIIIFFNIYQVIIAIITAIIVSTIISTILIGKLNKFKIDSKSYSKFELQFIFILFAIFINLKNGALIQNILLYVWAIIVGSLLVMHKNKEKVRIVSRIMIVFLIYILFALIR